MQEKNTTIPRVKTTSKEETRQDQHFGKRTSKIQLWRWKGPEVCGKFVLDVSARVLGGRSVLQWLAPKFVGKADLGGRLGPTWIQWVVCVCLRTASMEWNAPGKHGPHGDFFFFLVDKEPATKPDGETFSPFIDVDTGTSFFSADVLKKCALIALHSIAEERRNGEGCHVPGLGDEWEMGCPKSPMWESGDEAWSDQWLSRRQRAQRCVARHRFVWAW